MAKDIQTSHSDFYPSTLLPMSGNLIDRGTAGFLVLIIPLAVGTVLLFTAWPLILLAILLGLVWKVWQDYRWSRLSAEVNPYFNQLLQQYQGCLTPMDLSVKTNLPAKTAKQFLEKKADEFGAQKKTLGDRGTVYYFITASTLGSIFDESELDPEEESPEPPEMTAISASSLPLVSPTPTIREKTEDTVPPVPVTNLGKLLESVEEAIPPVPVTNLGKLLESVEEEIPPAIRSMVLSDLAKHLEVTPAMLGKRKKTEDFADWSRSKDPQGIAWKFDETKSIFVAIEE
jgi:hypothetical protein